MTRALSSRICPRLKSCYSTIKVTPVNDETLAKYLAPCGPQFHVRFTNKNTDKVHVARTVTRHSTYRENGRGTARLPGCARDTYAIKLRAASGLPVPHRQTMHVQWLLIRFKRVAPVRRGRQRVSTRTPTNL